MGAVKLRGEGGTLSPFASAFSRSRSRSLSLIALPFAAVGTLWMSLSLAVPLEPAMYSTAAVKLCEPAPGEMRVPVGELRVRVRDGGRDGVEAE